MTRFHPEGEVKAENEMQEVRDLFLPLCSIPYS